MKLKLKTLAGNHQFYYWTGKHKTFNVTVAAKFLTHAEIKYTKLQLADLLSLGLMFVKNSPLSILKVMRAKENSFLFCLTVYL